MRDQIRRDISSTIEQQFPAHYRENYPAFIEFTKSYYEWMETLNERDYFQVRDIDSTFNRFLNYYRKKFLSGIEDSEEVDVRFIIKHIQDLYQRKGSEESLRLLFKLFFNEEIEVFYPSTALLKPSDSKYVFNKYIEMAPVYTVTDYPLRSKMKIVGQTTGATAFIDEIIFKNFEGKIVPLMFISNNIGEFTIDDRIGIIDQETGNVSYLNNVTIAGSISKLSIDENLSRLSGYKFGDEFDIISKNNNGFYGRAIASEVSASSTTGDIDLDIFEGGYGYTLAEAIVEGYSWDDKEASYSVHFTGNTADPEFIAPDSTMALNFKNSSIFYNVVGSEPVSDNLDNFLYYDITVDRKIERDLSEGEAIKFYDAEKVSNIFISNQTLRVDMATIATFSLEEIADEVERLAAGLTTPSSETDTYNELWTYLQATNAVTGRKNADINNSGSISSIDAQVIRKAANGDRDSLIAISSRFDRFTKGTFEELEYLVANSSPTSILGQVIRWEEPLLHIHTTASEKFPAVVGSFPVRREDGTVFDITYSSEFNSTAILEVQNIETSEDVTIITSKISEFTANTIDQYVFTGNTEPTDPAYLNSNTSVTIGEFFDKKEFTIGSIKDIKVLDSGFGYDSEIYTLVEQPFFSKFETYDYIVKFQSLDVVLLPGDTMTQLTTNSSGEQYTAQAQFLKKVNEDYYFTLKSFYGFTQALPVTIKGKEYNLTKLIYDTDSKVQGLNADVNTTTVYKPGQLTQMSILDAGFGYADGDTVQYIDSDGRVAATGEIEVRLAGVSEGRWKTKSSFVSEASRFLHDNKYYQEYSYEISSSISPRTYEDLVRDTVGVAGTKLFSSPLVISSDNLESNIDTEIEFFLIEKEDYHTEASTFVNQLPAGNEPLTDEANNTFTTVATVALKTIKL